jgi:hypothetical protein
MTFSIPNLRFWGFNFQERERENSLLSCNERKELQLGRVRDKEAVHLFLRLHRRMVMASNSHICNKKERKKEKSQQFASYFER